MDGSYHVAPDGQLGIVRSGSQVQELLGIP